MRRFWGMALVAGLMLVGCGGGSGTVDVGAVATSPGGSGQTGGVVGVIDTEKCTQAALAMAQAASAVPNAISGIAGDLQTSMDELQAVTDAAPSEIRADLQIVTDGYRKVAEILADANIDPNGAQPPSAEVIQQLTAAGQELDRAEFRAAADRVNAWFAGGCGA